MTQNNRPVRRPNSASTGRYEAPQRRSANGTRPAPGRQTTANSRSAAGTRKPVSRPSAGSRGGSIAPSGGALPRGFWPLLGVCVLILAVGALMQGLLPDGFVLTGVRDRSERPVAAQVSEIHGEGPIRINEIMSANGGVLVDESGETPDWIEVANIGSRPTGLQGYILAKSAKAGNVFVFPDKVLQPGECVLVYADSTLQDEEGGELHAPFRLSSGGDVLMLFNDADVAVDTVNIPALSENTAYVRVDRNTWTASEQVTPGMLNTDENYRAMTSVVQDSPVQMVEIVASNSKLRPDESGVCHDYVVLRNTSGDMADISGWYLSDDPRLPRQWKFPQGVTIPGGGSLVVYCSGLDRRDDPGQLHTNFRLSSEGETLILSNASGQPVDRATYDLLKTDTAYMRGGDGTWSVGVPEGASAPQAPATDSAAPAEVEPEAAAEDAADQ